jgi:hypothetical protein
LSLFSNDPLLDAIVSPINSQEKSLLDARFLPISTKQNLHDQEIEPHFMIILATIEGALGGFVIFTCMVCKSMWVPMNRTFPKFQRFLGNVLIKVAHCHKRSFFIFWKHHN